MTKRIQVDWDWYVRVVQMAGELDSYFSGRTEELDGVVLSSLTADVMQGVKARFRAIERRKAYTTYMTAESAEDRERAWLAYLEQPV